MTKEMKLDKDYYSVCANALIRANQKMTLREMQLVQLAIAQIVKEDKQLFTYTTTASELANFLGVDIRSIYQHYETIARNLLRNVITIDINGERKSFQWVSLCIYNRNNNTITIRLHDELKPFLIGLNKLYTQIDLATLLKLKSYYSLRLYQLLVCEHGQSKKKDYNMSLDELRDFFGVSKDKYSRGVDLIKKTIKVAIDELNTEELCTITDFSEIRSVKKGKPITAVTFKVKNI